MRYRRSEVILSLVLMVLAEIVVIVLSTLSGDPLLLSILPNIPIALWVFYLVFLRRQLKHSIIAADGRVCTKCVYDLGSSPSSGICPECGCGYDIGDNINLWHSRYTWPYSETTE